MGRRNREEGEMLRHLGKREWSRINDSIGVEGEKKSLR